ncbi:MAG: hypothetical protein AAGF12_02390 [Myxococcota bacterium]
MPFPYYARLSKQDKATYRQSDAIGRVDLPEAKRLRPLVEEFAVGLGEDDRISVQRAASQLVQALLDQLAVAPATVKVLAKRPRSSQEELHGLYVRTEGERAVIQIWMRTAANRRPVKARTLLRTLLHEICHHLDYEHLGLADSFHTEGFFKRESSLLRQLMPKSTGAGRPRRKDNSAATGQRSSSRRKPRQPTPAPSNSTPSNSMPSHTAPSHSTQPQAAPSRRRKPRAGTEPYRPSRQLELPL